MINPIIKIPSTPKLLPAYSLIVLLAGALVPFSQAQSGHWVVGIIVLAVLGLLIHRQKPLHAAWLGLLFGIGLYFSGASWVFISIHTFGPNPWLISFLITCFFCVSMAVLFTVPACYIYALLFHRRPVALLFAFPALWTLGEWSRSWVFGGFPWLHLGDAHTDSLLGAWAPIIGVYGISFIIVTSAVLLPWCYRQWQGPKWRIISALVGVLTLWIVAYPIKHIEWTKPSSAVPLTVALIQPNVPQQLKWQGSLRQSFVEQLQTMSEPHWGVDLLMWPESALPMYYSSRQSKALIHQLTQRAEQEGTTLVTGILNFAEYQNQAKLFNSAIFIGTSSGLYNKRVLVPFGEYVPLLSPNSVLARFFGLAGGNFSSGDMEQKPLFIGSIPTDMFICFEIANAGLVARSLERSQGQVILTMSNDAWFLDSLGPKQHYTMARMRAKEHQRFVVRATNNGISGVIDASGKVIAQAEAFTPQTVVAQVTPRQGFTPFTRWGTLPIIILCLVLVIGCYFCQRINFKLRR